LIVPYAGTSPTQATYLRSTAKLLPARHAPKSLARRQIKKNLFTMTKSPFPLETWAFDVVDGKEVSTSTRTKASSVRPATRSWWSQSGSNRRPQACKASALPTELWPRYQEPKSSGLRCASPSGALRYLNSPPRGSVHLDARWWAREDSNLRPHAYQACALTN
jgi:hypothetical protein